MGRPVAFVLGLIVAITFNFVECSSNEIISNIQATAVPNIAKFLEENPGAKLQQLRKSSMIHHGSITVTYSLGQFYPGQKVLAYEIVGDQRFDSPQDVKVNVHPIYANENGKIAYVQIHMDQGTTAGQAYVVSGGIGQSTIDIVIEIPEVKYYSYQAMIYGN